LNEIGGAKGGFKPYAFEGPSKPPLQHHGRGEPRMNMEIYYLFETGPEAAGNEYYVEFLYSGQTRVTVPATAGAWGGAGEWTITYGVRGERGYPLTGEGKPLQIMSTVIAIVKDFIKKYTENYVVWYINKYPESPRKAELGLRDIGWNRGPGQQHPSTPKDALEDILAPETLNFQFIGISKRGETDAEESTQPTGRTKLYMAFLKKQMPAGTEVIKITENKIRFKVPFRTD